jgi:hypothetical protein
VETPGKTPATEKKMTEISLAFVCDVNLINDPETVNVEEKNGQLVLLGDLESDVILSIYSTKKREDVFKINCNDYYFDFSMVSEEKKGMRKVQVLSLNLEIPNNEPQDSMADLVQSGRLIVCEFTFKDRKHAEDVQNVLQNLEANLKQRLHDNTIADVHRRCAASGRFDVSAYARENVRLFRLWNREYEKSIEEMTDYLETHISEMIRQNTLSGFLDSTTHVYTDRQLVPTEQKVVNVNINMDFNSLLELLGDKGVILTTIKCPQCGSPVDVPEQGSMFTCPACASMIKVTDVAGMFRDLLGG